MPKTEDELISELEKAGLQVPELERTIESQYLEILKLKDVVEAMSVEMRRLTPLQDRIAVQSMYATYWRDIKELKEQLKYRDAELKAYKQKECHQPVIYAIGTPVWIGNSYKLEGVVYGCKIANGLTHYQVGYWVETDYRLQWFLSSQVSRSDEDRLEHPEELIPKIEKEVQLQNRINELEDIIRTMNRVPETVHKEL
jgi:hypothetical protein